MEFDEEKYKIYTWKSWMALFWIFNPALAINELILGQRIPKISLEDKTSKKSRLEKIFVPCPHCNMIHDSRTWSTKNGTVFKNWFGLYCTNCGNIIPCITNGFSFIILTLTYPLWGWFKKSLQKRWLVKQPDRYIDLDLHSIPNPYEGKGWISQGLSWAFYMFIFMTLFFLLIDEEPLTGRKILIYLVTWTILGLGFGYMMKKSMNK